MNTNELKFMLKLLGYQTYRGNWSLFKDKEKTKVCQELERREYVDYSREIVSAQILPAGKALLQIETSQLPITAEELKVLEKIAKAGKKIAPSAIKITKLKSDQKEVILKTLGERGLIKTELKIKKNQAEVWLTDRGLEFLRSEYIPSKTYNPVISLELLGNYIRFLRKNAIPADPSGAKPVVDKITDRKITDEEILQTIKNLDRELGTENYLPIFHLREKLQPPLLRDEVDQALYRLQKSDKIDFSSLQEVTAYTPEQIDAGIPQNIGGQLFFIMVN
ncbi:transcription factor RcaD [Cylindrospermopsis raciborskii CENA303]|uniref:Transcription factor RcaD n=1 Tax=Cylindrospermopsis raciborskii CENA303 TaxID=1170769 RepID=A0A1X4G899_9CYAN|nr:transcription factor RcaD [Cylindrospermopsis raciborskii]OSO92235.1 transcription factor RcaD [Cylindrospermopsis raciborskii CENA303]